MKICFFFALLLLSLSRPITADAAPAPETSILRVNITSQGYNFALPWQKQRPNTRRGLGALLAGNRVLVTAELAQDANYIELEQAASGKRITARVEAVDYELNLATVIPGWGSRHFLPGHGAAGTRYQSKAQNNAPGLAV